MLRDVAGEGPARAQYFNVACALGHRLRGERTEGYQALRCPTCGAGVFVLPRSPLPEPPAPATALSPRARGSVGQPRLSEDVGLVELKDPVPLGPEAGGIPGVDVEVDIAWDDEPSTDPGAFEVDGEIDFESEMETSARPKKGPAPAPAPERGGKSASGRTARPRRDGGVRPSGTREGADAKAAQEEEAVGARGGRRLAAGPIVVEERARSRRRVRIGPLFLAVALIVVAAVSWRAWRQRRQEYPLIAERARAEGIPALDRGDFDRAHQLLSAGKSAVDALSGAVEGAEDVSHAADEAAIFVNLAPDSLEEMLDEAARLSPESWSERFGAIYKGRAYLFDSWITAAPGKDGQSGAYELAYVVLPAGASGRFGDGGLGRPERYATIDLEDFRLFASSQPALGDRVIFGARLAEFRFDGEFNHWVVRLVPDSGVFMTHAKALESLGWPRPGADVPPPEQEATP